MTKAEKILEYIRQREVSLSPSLKAIVTSFGEEITQEQMLNSLKDELKDDELKELISEFFAPVIIVEEPVIEEPVIEPVIEQVITPEKTTEMSEETQNEVSKGKRPFAALDTVEIKRRLEVYRQALKLDPEDVHILSKIEQLEEELGKPGR